MLPIILDTDISTDVDDTLTLHIIDIDASYSTAKLGKNIDEDGTPQVIVKDSCFFATETNDKESFSLTGWAAAPGFDFADRELPNRNKLIELFPQHGEIIKKFTRLTV